MFAELSESDAAGPLALIYERIRALWAVPYVSSLQRHLATRDGWLEWSWACLSPVFESGLAQSTAWRAAGPVVVPAALPISRAELRLLGVRPADEASIRNICRSFVRVSPVNLMFSGLLRKRLTAGDPGRCAGAPAIAGAVSELPPMLAAAVPMVAIEAASEPLRDTLLRFSTRVDGQDFVPGLYRMLAQWPALLAHEAISLLPQMTAAEMVGACTGVCDAIDVAVDDVYSALPQGPLLTSPPCAAEIPDVLDALNRYRMTSPQMVVMGAMIERSLPRPAAAAQTEPTTAPSQT